VRTLLLPRNAGFEFGISEATQTTEFHFPNFVTALLSAALAMNPPNFFAELKRRNVIRMAGLYLVGAWLLTQVASTLLPTFEVPSWVLRGLILTLALGFIPSLILSWVFELTPEGLKREAKVPPEQSISPQTARRMNRVIIVVLMFAIGYFAFDKFVLMPRREAALVASIVPDQSRPPVIDTKSVAVLPFENLSEEKTNEFFAGGVQDEILTNLARIADLKVISRTSVMQYKSGLARNLREIGQQLGVANVLEGSVQRAGNRVRVNAQLIDAHTDQHLWAQTYDRDLVDVFAIQSEIAQAIANELQAKISASEKAAIEKPPTTDLNAYELYLRATSLIDDAPLSLGKTINAIYLQAAELLDQATARDPSFLLAYCRLAEAHDELYYQGGDQTPERLALGKAAIEAAFRLKPDSGEAHLALATHSYHVLDDLDRARDEIAVALQTLPNNARLFEWSGYIDRRQSRWHDALRNFDRAMELDPRNAHILIGSWVAYSLTRNYTRAREICDRFIALEPDNVKYRFTCVWNDFYQGADIAPWHAVLNKVLPQDAPTHLADGFFFNFCERDAVAANHALELLGTLGEETLQARGISEIQITLTCARGLVAWMKGDTATAQAAFAAARLEQEEVVRKEHATVERLHSKDSYEGSALSILGLIDAGLRRKEDALREGRQALELTSLQTNSFSGADVRYFYAVICAWTGERDLAIKQLQGLINVPIGLTYGDLKLSPYWDPLRDDPRFEELIEEAKAPVELKPSPSGHGQ